MRASEIWPYPQYAAQGVAGAVAEVRYSYRAHYWVVRVSRPVGSRIVHALDTTSANGGPRMAFMAAERLAGYPLDFHSI